MLKKIREFKAKLKFPIKKTQTSLVKEITLKLKNIFNIN